VLAAGRSKDAAFAISVSAPLVTADEQIQFATRNLLTVRGYSQSDVQDMLAARKAWTGYLHRKSSRDEAVEALRRAEAKPWFDIAYLPKASQPTNDPEHDPNRNRLDDDPIAAVQQAKVPVLISVRGLRSMGARRRISETPAVACGGVAEHPIRGHRQCES